MWTGYRGYLSQVLMNLFTNVDRYAYPERTGGRVDITLEADDDAAKPSFIIVVTDHGEGMQPEQLARIFEPFYTTGRIRGGTGLGMAIVYNIVTSALQGSIDVESSPGNGTTIRMEFPQRVEPEPEPE
jgi:signal transduction histidine kinase